MTSKVSPNRVSSLWNCYRLLFSWLQIIGISGPLSEIRSISWRVAAVVYTILLLAFDAYSHVSAITKLTQGLNCTQDEFSTTNTYSWNNYISSCNWTFQDLGCHVALILALQRSSLSDAFRRMENCWADPVPGLLSKCRLAVAAGLAYIIAKELIYILIVMFWPQSTYTLWENIMLIGCQMQYYYPISAFVLFCLLSFSITHNFAAIGQEIQEFHQQLTFLKVDELTCRLKQWRRRHAAVCQCADEFNRAFGFFLLVEICSIFVGVINKTFYLLVTLMETGDVASGSLFFVIGHLLHLWLLCHLADEMRSQATRINRSIVDLKMRYSFWQIDGLSKQVTHFLPKLTAMGYFRVNRQLFPTLLQTFLTYFIILYQFQSSERSSPPQN